MSIIFLTIFLVCLILGLRFTIPHHKLCVVSGAEKFGFWIILMFVSCPVFWSFVNPEWHRNWIFGLLFGGIGYILALTIFLIGLMAMVVTVSDDKAEEKIVYHEIAKPGQSEANSLGASYSYQVRKQVLIPAKWFSFFGHLISCFSVLSGLLVVNRFTSPDNPWFIWPALCWSTVLLFHLLDVLFIDNKVEIGNLTNSNLKAQLDKVYGYQKQIRDLVKTTPRKSTHTHLQNLASRVDEWTQAIIELIWMLDCFERDIFVQRDLKSVPKFVQGLAARLTNETDSATRIELQRALISGKNQLASLEHLQRIMKRLEIKVTNTVFSLGTMYSKILTIRSTNYEGSYNDLLTDVDTEIRSLQDHLEVLEEVKLGNLEIYQF